MKDVIIFASKHHENTRKIVQTIQSNFDIDIIDATVTQYLDLSKYNRICFASGICYGSYYPEIISFIENNNIKGHKVLLMHSAGNPKEAQSNKIKSLIEVFGGQLLGVFCCKGFDTYGPFKLIGGINKDHPDDKDINNAIEFFKHYFELLQR